MEDAQQFCLRWNNYQSSITSAFENLRGDEDFVDVTLASEGRSLKAHRVVLSACSPYFKELLKSTPCKHPVVVLQDVPFADLTALVQFMYHGEVNIDQGSLASFLRTAEMLHVSGLTQQGAPAQSTNGATSSDRKEERLTSTPQINSNKGKESPFHPAVTVANNADGHNSPVNGTSSRRNSEHSDVEDGVDIKATRKIRKSSPSPLGGVESEEDGEMEAEDDDQKYPNDHSPDGYDGSDVPNNESANENASTGNYEPQNSFEMATSPPLLPTTNYGGGNNNAPPPLLELPQHFRQLAAGFGIRHPLGSGSGVEIKREPGFDMLGLPGPSAMAEMNLSACKTGMSSANVTGASILNHHHAAAHHHHHQSALSSKYLCPLCGKVLSSRPSLKRHITDKHVATKEEFRCPICDRVYSSRNSLLTHTYTYHKSRDAAAAAGAMATSPSMH